LQVKQSHPQRQSFTISKYGTLEEVFNANGNSKFGKLKLEGYSVSYKFPGQKTKTVSAFGTTAVSLLPGQVTIDGQSASVTVTTDDQALEITSSFTLDLEREHLRIRRSVKIKPGQTVRLMKTEQTLDPKLIGVESTLGPELIKEAVRRRGVTATGCTNQAVENPPHDPPCYTVVCSSKRAFIEMEKPTALGWKCKKTSPVQSSMYTSDMVLTEAHFVVGLFISDR
jgi:hypothetical protein